MTKNTRVTIKDVAKLADVSISTVSLVVSNSPKVAAKTRKRVLDAIEELQYTPNEYASSLRTSKRHIFAAVTPDLSNPFYLEVIRGLKEKCAQNGIILYISETFGDFSVEKAELGFLSRLHPSGYMFAGTLYDDELIENINAAKVVCVDKIYGYENRHPQIILDNTLCMQRATAYLISQGCRKICYMTSPLRSFGLEDRLEGFVSTMKQHGLPCENNIFEMFQSNDTPLELGYFQMLNILQKMTPDAVIATSDLFAIGAMKALKDKGLRIPEDVSVVGFDNTEMGRFYSPTLTTFDIPTKKMGELAFDFLTDRLDNNLGRLVVETNFIVRDSARS